jgi:general secretion pathway protein C
MGRLKKPDEAADRSMRALRERVGAARLRVAVVAVLTLAIVVQATQISIDISKLARTPRDPRSPATVPVTGSPRLTTGDIVAAHLFGKPPEAPADLPASSAEHWVLSGTVEGETPTLGSAILGPTTATTRFRVVGEEVSGGFRLAEVFADHVTLERSGARVSLRLPHTLAGLSTNPGVRLASAAVREQAPVTPGPDRSQALLPAEIELQPDLERPWGKKGKNKAEGMRVWGAGDGRNLSAVGLQRNDIIRSVDGQPINNNEAQQRALEILSLGKPVPVVVERNGTVFTLQLGFREFSENGS